MSQIFDRFNRIVRSVINDTVKTSAGTFTRHEDDDMREAWEELNSFLENDPEPGKVHDSAESIPENIRTAYIRLDLNPGAPWPEVQKAYRNLLYANHPDRNSSPDAGKNTREILTAFRSIKAWQEEKSRQG